MTSDEAVGGPVDDHGEDGHSDGAELHIELTPAQAEALRRTMNRVSELMVPKFDLLKFAIPEQTMRNLATVSRIVEAQQSLVSRAVSPILEAQSAWKKQFATINGLTINSDVFKKVALIQSNLNRVATQLTANFDFSAFESVARAVSIFTEQKKAWLDNIGPAIAAMRANFYPPNLRGIEGLELELVEQVVMVDGIPLYGVPRTSVAEALIRADGASRRRETLGRRWKTISADCRLAVNECSSSAVALYQLVALTALDALDEGHTAAAQALAGSLIDAILSSYFGNDRSKYTPAGNGKRTTDAYSAFSTRQFIAFAPMWQAYQKYFVTEGDKVPMTFSRNATAHTVSPRQYNRRNAVQGLMFACSLLYRLDEEAAVLEGSAHRAGTS